VSLQDLRLGRRKSIEREQRRMRIFAPGR